MTLFQIPLIFCFYYPIIFIAKNLTKLILNRDVIINDYIINLIWLIIFPIGIWFFQPKINKLAEQFEKK
jgi:hypothetical protein